MCLPPIPAMLGPDRETFAQAAIRSLFDHSATQLWGAFGWVPGEWGGRLIVFLLLAAAGVVLAGWAHDRGKQVSR